jgi:hypothetical protein
VQALLQVWPPTLPFAHARMLPGTQPSLAQTPDQAQLLLQVSVPSWQLPQGRVSPILHTPGLPQQTSPVWPHDVHVLPAPHWAPAAQDDPAQQGWPAPPQATHRLPLHRRLAPVQPPLAQQGCPVPPHATHWFPPPHTAPEPQDDPAQQGWPAPPHVVQPDGVQALPAVHALDAQQGWVLPPHATQWLPEQASAASLQRLPGQHRSPRVPQATHWLPAQTLSPLHRVPQQGWPAAPQATHWLALLHRAPVPQLEPQQACPTPPHGLHVLPVAQA